VSLGLHCPGIRVGGARWHLPSRPRGTIVRHGGGRDGPRPRAGWGRAPCARPGAGLPIRREWTIDVPPPVDEPPFHLPAPGWDAPPDAEPEPAPLEVPA